MADRYKNVKQRMFYLVQERREGRGPGNLGWGVSGHIQGIQGRQQGIQRRSVPEQGQAKPLILPKEPVPFKPLVTEAVVHPRTSRGGAGKESHGEDTGGGLRANRGDAQAELKGERHTSKETAMEARMA